MIKHPKTRAERRRLDKLKDYSTDRAGHVQRKLLLEEVTVKELQHAVKDTISGKDAKEEFPLP